MKKETAGKLSRLAGHACFLEQELSRLESMKAHSSGGSIGIRSQNVYVAVPKQTWKELVELSMLALEKELQEIEAFFATIPEPKFPDPKP